MRQKEMFEYLLSCGLFSDTLSSPDQVINWERCSRKWSWPHWISYLGVRVSIIATAMLSNGDDRGSAK